MPSSTSPNMGLFLPVPGTTPGPQWASETTANSSTIDGHDHTTGKGVRVPTAGLNINADLALNSFGAVGAAYASFIDKLLTSNLTVNASLGNVLGQPYWRDAAGVVKKVLLTGDAASSAVFTALANGMAPASGGGTLNFLRADGSWVAPSSSGITAITGDLTASGSGSVASTLTNIPTGVSAAGSILFTEIAAPATPAAGKLFAWADSTDGRFHDKNPAGTIGTTVVPGTAPANQFCTAVGANGGLAFTQPASANLSDVTAAGTAMVSAASATAQTALLNPATTSLAGLMSAADKTKSDARDIIYNQSFSTSTISVPWTSGKYKHLVVWLRIDSGAASGNITLQGLTGSIYSRTGYYASPASVFTNFSASATATAWIVQGIGNQVCDVNFDVSCAVAEKSYRMRVSDISGYQAFLAGTCSDTTTTTSGLTVSFSGSTAGYMIIEAW